MVIVNIIMAVSGAIAYLLEGKAQPMVREMIIASNIIFFATFELFPYLTMLCMKYRGR